MTTIEYRWRGPVDNDAISALHAEAFEHRVFDDDWAAALERHSLGWVTATAPDGLVGFVNVVGDGGVHAWIQDVMVAKRVSREGVGTEMVRIATERSRSAGCEWLHVDFDDHLRAFYYDACGFRPTNAGLIEL